jgi:hypothetical protein
MAPQTLELAATTPLDEPCAQVGSENYIRNSRKEAQAFINQIMRKHGNPPKGVMLTTKSNPHDFGSYLDVVIRFDEDDEVASGYAYGVENDPSNEWDDEALKELKESGYTLAQ